MLSPLYVLAVLDGLDVHMCMPQGLKVDVTGCEIKKNTTNMLSDTA